MAAKPERSEERFLVLAWSVIALLLLVTLTLPAFRTPPPEQPVPCCSCVGDDAPTKQLAAPPPIAPLVAARKTDP